MKKSITLKIKDDQFIAMINRQIRLYKRNLITFDTFDGYLLALCNIGAISGQLFYALTGDAIDGTLEEIKMKG